MTKINGLNQNQMIKIYAAGKRPEEAAKKPFSQDKDAVEISREAREMQAIRLKYAEVPDIREEKVLEIQKKIMDGNYQIDLALLTENLLLELNFGIKK